MGSTEPQHEIAIRFLTNWGDAFEFNPYPGMKLFCRICGVQFRATKAIQHAEVHLGPLDAKKAAVVATMLSLGCSAREVSRLFCHPPEPHV